MKGITLKASRVNAGLSQKEAAEKLEINKSTLSNWETGKTYPTVLQLQKIEELYGVERGSIIFL